MKNNDKKEEYLQILNEAICRDIKTKEIPLLHRPIFKMKQNFK